MEYLPGYIGIIFVLTTLITVILFFKASHLSKITLIVFFIWLLLQTFIGISGFYKKTSGLPPRFIFLILPPLLSIILLFVTTRGRRYIDQLDTKTLTVLHTIRIPIELVLFWLYLNKAVPGLMTFEGANFDILSGLTAPFVFYFGYIKKTMNKKVILIWNFLCLGLLINVVIIAVLSAPLPFQKLAFDQPDIALLYFPYIWLPCFIVPVVLLAHLASIRQLIRK
jgi:hypothetical protein